MSHAAKGDWVEIFDTILTPEQRAPNLPEDTASVPYTFRLRGFAAEPGELGQRITIRTQSGRLVSGNLVTVNPTYDHNFGQYIPELNHTRMALKRIMGVAKA